MIQLRVRTEFSFGQTFAPIKKMVARLKELGCTAAGIVDNSTWGHHEWYTECKAAGIQPMLGAECAVSDEDTPLRMWFLARNAAGLSELYRALSKAHQQPISLRSGKVPRLTRGDVRRMSDDILKFAGDITDGAFLAEVHAIVDFAPGSAVLTSLKRRIAAEHGLVTVNTSDNAYIDERDRDILPLISRATLKPTPQHILPIEPGSGELYVAKACEGLEMPTAPMISAPGNLLELCREGIARRAMVWTPEYEERLLYELDLIRSKNFDSYFIVVADMCSYAKRHMLVGPSRGSAAGSLVCYVLGITEIDPIPPKLYFERFIDVTRSDLPDIDLDFPDSKRQMVFDYMAEKYGTENTAHIGTISRFKPKSALIEVCKAMGIPAAATAAVKASIIERGAADSRASNCLEDTLKETGPGREFAANYPEALVAAEIEGHASHTGVHAAGLLVCNDSITNYCVVDAHGIAHIEKGAAEKLGLLKIDVLGLRTLSVLEDSGVDIDWYGLKFDDQKVFDIFNEGRLCGIFQFEGNALRSISERIRFSHLLHVDAVTALARPGPFGGGVTGEYMERFNGKPYKAIHPLVEKQMAETYGLPVYQEQTLAIVREIGQFDWKDTSFIRKAMSKRLGTEVFEAYWQKFKAGAAAQGIDEVTARKTWDMINSMGAWQMNKAHTWSYAVISYWTAYLKAHHPLEFAAATLRNAKDEDSALMLLREMVKEGIEFEPFNEQLSEVNWSIKNGKLIGGFLNLHGFGAVNSAKFVADRDAGRLTTKQLEKIRNARNTFGDIFPMRTKYKDYYEGKIPVIGGVRRIEEFNGTQEGSYAFIGEIVYKNPRNANEEINVKKRGGKLLTGPLEFLDLRVRDDTEILLVRIDRRDYIRMGKYIAENIKVGSHLLLRCDFSRGFRFGKVQNYRVLEAKQ